MINNLRKLKKVWIILGILTLITSITGIIIPSIYDKVLDASILPATIAQDIMTFIVSLILLFLAFRVDNTKYRSHLIIIGSLGFFFYAYSIYAIERLYTVFYLSYLAIVGLSFYGLVYSVISINRVFYEKVKLSRRIKQFSSGYNILSAIIFSGIWISQLLPLISTGTKPEFLYSIYIIDLCFILPSLFLSALLAIRGIGLGVSMLMPTGIIGFTILAPLWLSELMKPVLYDLPPSIPEMSLFFVVSTIFLVSVLLNYRSLEINKI